MEKELEVILGVYDPPFCESEDEDDNGWELTP